MLGVCNATVLHGHWRAMIVWSRLEVGSKSFTAKLACIMQPFARLLRVIFFLNSVTRSSYSIIMQAIQSSNTRKLTQSMWVFRSWQLMVFLFLKVLLVCLWLVADRYHVTAVYWWITLDIWGRWPKWSLELVTIWRYFIPIDLCDTRLHYTLLLPPLLRRHFPSLIFTTMILIFVWLSARLVIFEVLDFVPFLG